MAIDNERNKDMNLDTLDREVLGCNASIGYIDIEAKGPCRPLEFPAPIVDRGMTVSTDVIDHRTGDIIHATSVLMRVHAHNKLYASRRQHLMCGSIDLPDKAYCVWKKLADTTYGSIRLCVVLKRVSDNVKRFASRLQGGEQCIPQWETTDEMVAIKVTNWDRLQSLRGRHLVDPIKELAAQQQLIGADHPHVISLLDTLQDEKHLFCIYPYLSGGDLYGAVIDEMANSSTDKVDESLARKWFRQILCAVSHLQKRGICHRGISLENLMIDEDNNVQLIDFGLCLRVPFDDSDNSNMVTDVSANTSRRLMKQQGKCGYWEYMAPEMVSEELMFDGFATDLWSVGIVLFELIVARKPFGMADPVDENFKTISVEGNLAGLLRLKDIDISSQAINLMQNILWNDPAKRLNLEGIINHPWVRGSNYRKPQPTRSPIEEGSSWFMSSKSIDELMDLKPIEFDDCFPELTIADSTASTADMSDPSDCSSSRATTLHEVHKQKKKSWFRFKKQTKATARIRVDSELC